MTSVIRYVKRSPDFDAFAIIFPRSREQCHIDSGKESLIVGRYKTHRIYGGKTGSIVAVEK